MASDWVVGYYLIQYLVGRGCLLSNFPAPLAVETLTRFQSNAMWYLILTANLMIISRLCQCARACALPRKLTCRLGQCGGIVQGIQGDRPAGLPAG